ncbi:ubiquinol-cytochrome-c reductase complex assembly factor 1-like isoform X3 [Oncorhynchus mykiss]|uniref:ubiquinol-cytochrome-c reductase complex assembly factor 1-like isoform X3 n=1 Tax=Oncorhynchus mykiss TaxID=8022 RepID=UPI0018777CF6|nr:ubiquinol-cytochrome-c reductase complex assembly factor 1-like isoform X3 [Oncorhynchus mykiss]
MGIDAIHRKESMRAMTETFYAAIFGYDEGILLGDGVLAAALWRNMFKRQCEDPRQLELMSLTANRCSSSILWTGRTCY